jgi:cytochrome c oxidase subunit 1
MIGAEDMAFPRLNMISFWTFATSTVILLASFYVPGGAQAGGWTAYPPLSGRMDYTGVEWGTNLWILAVALEFASALMTGINVLSTTVTMRAKGMTFFRMPLMVWMQNVANIIFMFSVGPLVAGAVMLLMDRLLGTNFFMPAGGGDPLLWQHLFWFFGHPEVYVLLLPALGVLTEVIPTFSRKHIFGYKTIIISTLVAGVLSFLVWAHHQFISGLNPGIAFAFSLTTIIISVPFAIIVFCFIATLWRGSLEFTAANLFALGMLAEFLIGGTTGIPLASLSSDIYMHDTYFVVAHFHYTMFPITFFAMFAGVYYWFPKMFGRMMDETWGKIHFWITAIGFNLVFFPLFFFGLAGHQRRIYDPSLFENLVPFQYLHVIATAGTILLLAGQIPFIINFFRSMKAGAKAKPNPWKANSLEWAAPSPPPHGNFESPLIVYRGPYEFSSPGSQEDFLPQYLPSAEEDNEVPGELRIIH